MKRESIDKNINLSDIRNTLREGDEGDEVVKLQEMLRNIVHICPNIPYVSLDGKYNNKTKIAVEIFQNMMGINRTGVVDNVTLERLQLIYNKKDEIKSIEKIEINNPENNVNS